MKLNIIESVLGGNPLRHLEKGTVIDLAVEDALPLLQAQRARLADKAKDQAEVTAYAKRLSAQAEREGLGRLR
jgi:hypothetical protein